MHELNIVAHMVLKRLTMFLSYAVYFWVSQTDDRISWTRLMLNITSYPYLIRDCWGVCGVALVSPFYHLCRALCQMLSTRNDSQSCFLGHGRKIWRNPADEDRANSAWKWKQTCRELKMVKSQANTAVFSLTASSPNTQVSPSSGRRIRVAFIMSLW